MAKESAASPQEQKAKAKLGLKTILVVLGVLLLQGGTFTLTKIMFSGPKSAGATSPIEDTVQSTNQDMAEVSLAEDFRVSKFVGTKAQIMVTMSVSAKVSKEKQSQLQDLVTNHSTEILDTVRVLVSSADPEHIKDPRTEVIKREIKSGVEKIIGEGLIEEILLPGWQPFDAD